MVFMSISSFFSGAFSNVYKAKDRRTGQKVAIKVVRKYELNSNQVGTPFSLFSRAEFRLFQFLDDGKGHGGVT